MAAKTFDFRKVTVIWGPIIFAGFAKDGDAIAAEYDEDHFEKDVGVDGEVAWSQNNNRTGKVTLRLMQSSLTNGQLSAQAAIDAASGTAVYPLLIKDLSGLSLVTTDKARILKTPGPNMGKSLGVREWVLDCAQMVMVTAGLPN